VGLITLVVAPIGPPAIAATTASAPATTTTSHAVVVAQAKPIPMPHPGRSTRTPPSTWVILAVAGVAFLAAIGRRLLLRRRT
jgi:hypothetical protein